MSSVHWYTCKSLLNTLGRVVEQLAVCLAKQAKVSSWGQSTTVMPGQREAFKWNRIMRMKPELRC